MNGHRDYAIQSVMHGLSGPIDGRTYPQVMVPMGSNNDQWIADVASYVRNSFGNSGALATTADVARVRSATGDERSVDGRGAGGRRCHARSFQTRLESHRQPRRASGAAGQRRGGYNYLSSAAGALTFLGWTTGTPQQPGMWFQIELPAPATLTELQFTSSRTGDDAAGGWTFPRRYQVQVSTDGTTWSAPVAEGEGRPGTTVVTFAPVSAKFVRITQTASVENGAAVVDATRTSLRGAGQSGRTEMKRTHQ